MTAQMIAYVYPGWHHDEYRPEVDEWNLLGEAFPRFDGHQPPARPVNGSYDDTDPMVVRRQIDSAEQAGIGAFSYFLYWGPSGYVMDKPMAVARDIAAEENRGFQVGATWCIRLPHDHFPIAAGDKPVFDESGESLAERLADRRLTSLTVVDLQALIPAWDNDWLDSTEPNNVRPTVTNRKSLNELRVLVDDLVSVGADALPLEAVMPILSRCGAAALSLASISTLLAVVASFRESASKCGALSVKELEDLAVSIRW